MGRLNPNKVYLGARRMAWFAAIALVLIMAASLALLGAAAVPVLTAGVPTLGALATVHVGIERGWGKWMAPPEEDS